MNKKIFGIKISTILTAFVCIVVAIMIWLLVKYKTDINAESLSAFFVETNMRLK